ncbi:hypothetical protein [Calothrix rhizosoleniae]|nr:hypothetical protein [Calothrix rhizosoleniae]
MSSQQQLNELQKLSNLLEEKIIRLRTAKAIATNAAVIFQLSRLA